MRRMRYTMAVRNPETLEVHALLEGSVVPSWANGLVADADTVDGPEPVPATGTESTGVGESDEPADVGGVKPDKTWTGAAIRAFAADHGIDLGEASTKADMLAAIEAV